MNNSSPDLSIRNISTLPHSFSLALDGAVKDAHQQQQALEKKLLQDKTKTKASRSLFAYEAAEKRLKKILGKVNEKQDELRGDMFKFNKKIAAEMKVAGTTDAIILQGYSAVLKDYKVSDVMELVRAGDRDALRSVLLLPVLKLMPQFRAEEARELFKTELEKQTLGEDYDIMQTVKQQQEDANRMETGILETSIAYEKAAKTIRATVVDKSEMPELG